MKKSKTTLSKTTKTSYCKECFCEIDPNSFCEDMCDECLNSPEDEDDEEWIIVKSPFTAYSADEGV